VLCQKHSIESKGREASRGVKSEIPGHANMIDGIHEPFANHNTENTEHIQKKDGGMYCWMIALA